MRCDAGEMIFGLADFLALRRQLEEPGDGVEVRAEFIARSITFPLELAVLRVMPLGGITAGAVHCLVAALALGPDGARGKPGDARHGLEPAQRLKRVRRLAPRLGVFGHGEAVR